MSEARGVVIFDLDDCLVMNVHHYWACWDMFKYVMCNLGFSEHEDELVDKLNELDMAGVAEHGFKRERFAEAMAETYEHYCGLAGVEPEEHTRDGIYDIGMSVYRHRAVMYPGAREVLEYLAGRGYLLVCVSKGEKVDQVKKLEETGLIDYFAEIICVKDDKEEAVRSVVGASPDVPRDRIHFIGNSLKSDMGAAVKCGIKGIWIPCYTWEYEECGRDAPGIEGKVRRLGSLRELKGIL